MSRLLHSWGADVILGHHPHVVQGIERKGRGVTAYSLGNFLFAPQIYEGGVLRIAGPEGISQAGETGRQRLGLLLRLAWTVDVGVSETKPVFVGRAHSDVLLREHTGYTKRGSWRVYQTLLNSPYPVYGPLFAVLRRIDEISLFFSGLSRVRRVRPRLRHLKSFARLAQTVVRPPRRL